MPGGPNKAFEYNFLRVSADATRDEILAQMNAMGADGWEAITAHFGGGFYRLWFKREKMPPYAGPTDAADQSPSE